MSLLLLLALSGVEGLVQDAELFEKKIRPVLHARCVACHGPEKQKAGLRVDSRSALLGGGDSGPALVPGAADRSLLMKALRQGEMPPPKSGPRLGDDVLRDLEAWINAGAPYPGGAEPPPKKHWAFEPLSDPPVPAGGHPVDAFLALAKAAPPADRRTLIRRATYDLTGLPPSAEDVDAFLAGGDFAKVVDRLLASPAYGEKWGRKWLDLVRYADTAGENSDFPAPHAWRYRNYVIGAFNRDLPYDQFVREQVAGDLLPEPSAEQITATGYLAIARRFGHDTDKDMHLTHEDVIDTLGKSILGLTLGCARCHNHKYDPVTARDYYALYGIFASTRFPFPGCEAKQAPRDLVPLRPGEVAYAVAEGKPADARFHARGEPEQLGDAVPRRNLEILGGEILADPGKSGRLELARWLTAPKNPLTARVLVNRVWLGHFGRGLVATPSDFGTRGAPPTHPALLDYLARRFIDAGWSVKALHRLILESAAYQRASEGDVDVPYARFARRRLDAEEIRDALLAAGGELDLSPGAGHPFPPEPWKFTQHAPFKAVYESKRRSVYLMTQRIQRHPFLALFDGPDTNASTARRDTSTVPTQALYFLNDPFFHARSEGLARRLLALPAAERVAAAHRACFQRPPAAAEEASARAFLAAYGAPEPAAWSAYARTLLGSNEFLYLD
ncbi:MAG TPA: PSD1 and planctomycete cytochrome C domain-containing protein [Planctomycetota bacterium]